jgi:hypothetical protein
MEQAARNIRAMEGRIHCREDGKEIRAELEPPGSLLHRVDLGQGLPAGEDAISPPKQDGLGFVDGTARTQSGKIGIKAERASNS